MNLQEIKDAVNAGLQVCWASHGYEVLKPAGGTDNDLQIVFKHGSRNTCGLTWRDGKTLNGKEEDFFVKWSRAPDGTPFATEQQECLARASAAVLESRETGKSVTIPYAAVSCTYLQDIAANISEGDSDEQGSIYNVYSGPGWEVWVREP